MVSEYKKKQIIVSGVMGAVLGFFVSLALYAMLNQNPVAWVFMPIATGMGIAQALLSPAAREED